MRMKTIALGFTLIEMLAVLALLVVLGLISYSPIKEGLRDLEFKAVVSEAQANMNDCYWKRQWFTPVYYKHLTLPTKRKM